MKEEKIKVLALLPIELPKEIELGNTLEAMQNFVGGLIESTCPPLLPILQPISTRNRFPFRTPIHPSKNPSCSCRSMKSGC